MWTYLETVWKAVTVVLATSYGQSAQRALGRLKGFPEVTDHLPAGEGDGPEKRQIR